MQPVPLSQPNLFSSRFNSAMRCPVHPLMSGATCWPPCPLIISIIQEGVIGGSLYSGPTGPLLHYHPSERVQYERWVVGRITIMSLPTLTVGYFDGQLYCDLQDMKGYYVRTWSFWCRTRLCVSPRLSSICIHSAREIFWFIWNCLAPFLGARNVFLSTGGFVISLI